MLVDILSSTVCKTPEWDCHSSGSPGILHLDCDTEKLGLCMQFYHILELSAIGYAIAEKKQPVFIQPLLKMYAPNIVVITGHDSMLFHKKSKLLDGYKNSRYFIESVVEARKYQQDPQELVIIAGGCQSNCEALIEAGANFASSPARQMIHLLDSVFLCKKIACTSREEIIGIEDALRSTLTGAGSLQGIPTYGKLV